MFEWEVARTQGVCAGCGQGLEPGQEYYAGLTEQSAQDEQGKAEAVEQTGGTGFERMDCCLNCWQELSPKVFCYWRTRVPRPAEKEKLLVDDGVLLNLFERLCEAQERVRVNLRFVLALILMRKRILKYERTDVQDGRELWIMGQVREETKHEVVNPQLDELQIQEVSEQLSSILRSEL